MIKDKKKQIQVLLVDDEIDIIELLSDELHDQDFIVETALTADAAVEKLEHFFADIILCDFRMPRKNGLYVLEEAKKKYDKNHSFLFYLVTGQSDLSKEESTRMGIQRCVQKPFDIFKLIEMIKEDLKERES